jgi:hypothetical protein
MVEILLSEKHKNFFHIKYSISTNSKEDDAHYDLLLNFARQHREFYMVVEMKEGTTITDRKWFETSAVADNPIFYSLKKAICFGFTGIQLSFMRQYFRVLDAGGIKTEMYKNIYEYESIYKLSVKDDFEVKHRFEVNL